MTNWLSRTFSYESPSNIISNIRSKRIDWNTKSRIRNNVNGQFEGINQFNPDHIISDPGLCIPNDSFAPNIRDDVRRAFIAKGPTQPIGHNFPQSHDKMSFQKHWFRQHSWLEYSLKKNKAYRFYCYLFKHDRIDDTFCHDAFILCCVSNT
jgi:hypothetical protein